jgi:tetratricopeptide (TPR) repeat protein
MNRHERRREEKKKKIPVKDIKATSLCLRGEKLAEIGKIEEAISAFREAVSIDSKNAVAHHNLGLLIRQEGELAEAVECYLRAISLVPNYFDAHYNLGNVLRDLGKVEEAIESFNQALNINPYSTNALLNRGNAYLCLRKFDEAVSSYRKAISTEPNNFAAHFNLGNALNKLDQSEEAILCYKQALEVNPNSAEVYFNLGDSLKKLGHFDKAVSSFNKALAIKTNFAEAHNNLGIVLKKLGKLDSAVNSYKQAIAITPNYAEAHNNLGNVLEELGDQDEAVARYEEAIVAKPDYAQAHTNLGLSLLNKCELKNGWREYEWRLRLGKNQAPKIDLEMWDGSSLREKNILVTAEQGIGDEIMSSGCISDLLKLNPNKIFLECDPRLVPLFARSFPYVQVFGKDQDQNIKFNFLNIDSDIPIYQISICSLPHFFRNKMEDFPKRGSFLMPDLKLVDVWKRRMAGLGKGLKVGISWRGGKPSLGLKNTIPLLFWNKLLSLEAFFINLQYGDVSDEIFQVAKMLNIKIHDWQDNDPLLDMDNQAALISTLDLVISVDNATVHSCGALGTPVWDIIDPSLNSMWFEQQTNWTPLYPHVRFFKKQGESNWEFVLAIVEKELREWIKDKQS